MTRTWWENEEIIRQFRDWLAQTAEEIEALDEHGEEDPFSDRGDEASVSLPDTDTWDEYGEPARELPVVGLLQLVEAFTALRHELKLQTKGARHLESSVEQALAGLNTASRVFQSAQADEREAAERATLPMIEALIGLDEGLLRAARAFQVTHRQLTQSAPARLRESLDQQFHEQSWWRRMMAGSWHARVREAACEALARSITEEFAVLMEGFKLIQTRLARTLQEHQIRRLDAAGGLVDPNRMSVVELVTDSTAPPETVVEVVRPGYCWGERVIRFAEVRAVASRARQLDDAGSLTGSGIVTDTGSLSDTGSLPDVATTCQGAEGAKQVDLDELTQVDRH